MENELRDAAHDAFMAFWRGERDELWAAYCDAQDRYEAHLLGADVATPPAHRQGRNYK